MEKPQGITTIYMEEKLQKRNIKMLSCLMFQGFTGFYVTVFLVLFLYCLLRYIVICDSRLQFLSIMPICDINLEYISIMYVLYTHAHIHTAISNKS